MRRPRSYYVLGLYGDPWVLTADRALGVRQCEEAVRWRGPSSGPWAICRYDTETGLFVDRDGATYAASRGPYTQDAWDNLIGEIAARTAEEPRTWM